MGEILAPALILLVVFVALIGTSVYFRSSSRQRNLLIGAPAVLLPPGEAPDVLLANAQKTYALMQRSARVLDRLGTLDGIAKADRNEIKSILHDFYN